MNFISSPTVLTPLFYHKLNEFSCIDHMQTDVLIIYVMENVWKTRKTNVFYTDLSMLYFIYIFNISFGAVLNERALVIIKTNNRIIRHYSFVKKVL